MGNVRQVKRTKNARMKYGVAYAVAPLLSMDMWFKNKISAKLQTGEMSPDFSTIELKDFNPKQFLLTQCTIVPSVMLEKNGYYIKPESAKYVNLNGDCWTEDVLKDSYKTFRGAFNFVNHVQIKSLSVGRLLDSITRKVGDLMLVDILTATDRKHEDLIERIESGDLKWMSLGAKVSVSKCSQCGKMIYSDEDYCDHLLNHRREAFTDKNGIERIVAEICGEKGNPESNIFIEASWVDDPAFLCAELSNILKPVMKVDLGGKKPFSDREIVKRSLADALVI